MTFAPKCSSDSGASTGDSHTDIHHAMHQLNHESRSVVVAWIPRNRDLFKFGKCVYDSRRRRIVCHRDGALLFFVPPHIYGRSRSVARAGERWLFWDSLWASRSTFRVGIAALSYRFRRSAYFLSLSCALVARLYRPPFYHNSVVSRLLSLLWRNNAFVTIRSESSR